MKTYFYKLVAVLLAVSGYVANAQKAFNSTTDSLQGFDEVAFKNYFIHNHSSMAGYDEFIASHKAEFIRNTYYPSAKIIAPLPTPQAACTNMDFELGNLSGWSATTGYHPLYNAAGCCATAGGAQQIMTGAGVDPCGGFPVVSPAGNFSVKIGNNQVGGVADRLEQTFTVSNANVNYTYQYAVVLQDAGSSHAASEQPRFEIDMTDSAGNIIPCTQYIVAGGQGIPGFINSTNCGQAIYKPWTTVTVDLTNYVGQNVTIRFTTYDCAFGGHYAYAYVDGSCSTFQLTQNDTICAGTSTQICAPNGFAGYLWTGQNINNQNTQCINVNTAGTYSVQVTSVTGCPGPTFEYQVHTLPAPIASFNIAGNGNILCTPNVSFNNYSPAQVK